MKTEKPQQKQVVEQAILLMLGAMGKWAKKQRSSRRAITQSLQLMQMDARLQPLFSITENILALNVDISQTTEIKCAGDKSAILETSITGGKGPFAYQWNKAGLDGEKANGLAADEYAVTVTDAVGNTATANFKVREPQAVMIAAKVDAPASTGNADGKATASASGRTGKFSYKWTNGETAKTATKLAPGEHQVTVTDEAGCTGVAVVEISENILPLQRTSFKPMR